MKEYQVVEGKNVESLNVKIAELGVKGWNALTMRCVPITHASGEIVPPTQNVAIFVLMELDLAEAEESESSR